MASPEGAPVAATTSAVLPAALWFVTAVAAALPGWLLLTNADSRLLQVAGTALLLASIVSAGMGVACTRRRSAPWLGLSVVIVLLCLSAPIILGVDGRVSLGGSLLFGGGAGVLAGLAGALTVRACRHRPSSVG